MDGDDLGVVVKEDLSFDRDGVTYCASELVGVRASDDVTRRGVLDAIGVTAGTEVPFRALHDEFAVESDRGVNVPVVGLGLLSGCGDVLAPGLEFFFVVVCEAVAVSTKGAFRDWCSVDNEGD